MALGLCLAAAALIVPIGSDTIRLVWHHSVEKTLWEEAWRAGPAGLEIDWARVTGSGAGMEPGEGAALIDGAWQWRPRLAPLPELQLGRSSAVADWRICVAAQCRPLSSFLPDDAAPARLIVCPAP